MAESRPIRLIKAAKELNVGKDRIVEFLASNDVEISPSPNTKIEPEHYELLLEEFASDLAKKQASEEVSQAKKEEKEALRAEMEKAAPTPEPAKPAEPEVKEEEKAPEPVAEEPKKEEEKPAPAAEEPVVEEENKDGVIRAKAKLSGPKTMGKIELETPKPKKAAAKKEEAKKEEAPKPAAKKEAPKKVEAPKAEKKKEEAPKKAEPKKETPAAKEETPEAPKEREKIDTKYEKLDGPKFVGEKIDLSKFDKPKKKKVASSAAPTDKEKEDRKKRRRRISTDGPGKKAGPDRPRGTGAGAPGRGGSRRNAPARAAKVEPTEEEIQKQIKETLDKLTGGSKSKGAKHRRAKRDERREQEAMSQMQQDEDNKIIKVTEFVTVSELATMMDVPINSVISTCMTLGIMVTMNQRLDAETLSIVAEEFGFEVEFVSADLEENMSIEEDKEEDLKDRAPIVTVMGHVDHGKTSLLDYIRSANVIAGESGGITQHIGAYSVEIESGQRIAFLDTPGHEAFTAMRARGAQVTDIAIIVVAADDDIMPQTKEAISHAQAANVPIVFAINKVDRPSANPEKIKEGLAAMNLLVEDWGGKVQSHDISAKTGQGVNELLEKVLLEAELLELKANPDKNAMGTVVEASLDKGRGYVSTIMVQAGSLRIGDYILAGQYSGKVKAMYDERNKDVEVAHPSTPVTILGLDGAPQAGDKFVVMDDEREAKAIATKRMQLQREQSVRTQKNLTLDEIGRRLALGDFQELNIILKGDVDGSIEALSDSLQKLSTDEIQVNIIHKAVGQVTESDILLAAASDAIIVGFQVRPSVNARKLAEKEQVDIRLYSIIYDAINEIKDAMEGLLSPDIKEKITCNIEVRETFKISKVGTIAGCMVLDGTVNRNSKIRLIRDGVVVYTGLLGSLKRFKDDVKEVKKGFECGLNIENFNDIKVGDIIEGYEEVEVKKTLS